MRRVILTGAGGFIGRPVASVLTAGGVAVEAWTEPVESLSAHAGPAGAVIHLASTPRHEAPDWSQNIVGMQSVLDYCRTSGARCLFASTAGVYRAAGARPVDETAVTAPENAYAASKLAGESLCAYAAGHYGVRSAILRLFNVYGPGQRPPFVIPSLFEAMSADRDCGLRMPHAVRDFVFVDDVAEAFAAAVEMPLEGCRVFNVGTGLGTRIGDVAAAIAQLLGTFARWSANSEPCGDDAYSVADISRARAELEWEPRTDLDAGLAATWAAWRRRNH